MNTRATSQPIGNIDELERRAREAADQLSQATSRNAIWDKAAKALKTGMTDLPKTRDDAKKESEQAHQMLRDLADRYDSDASDGVRKARTAADEHIRQLWDTMKDKERKFNEAQDAATAAKKSLDESNANFEQAQKNLLGVSKELQDQQKQVAALKAEVTDADKKRQLVESIVRQEDLRNKLADFDEKWNADYEANLWKELNAAAKDLLEKSDALLAAQARVSESEAEYKAAKTEYENAVKNRIEAIKQLVPDDPVLPKPSYGTSPSMG